MSTAVGTFAKSASRSTELDELVDDRLAGNSLLRNFGVLADTSAGVGQLRGLALHLAIRGRLLQESPLPPADTPATEGLSVPFGLPKGWAWRRVAEVGELKLGRQRSPANHSGPNMRPYLRVANVQEARIDTSDVLWMNFEPLEAERFLLKPNDVLLNEGQSYELVGRPAIYRGEVVGACFQNTLIRFRPTQVLPEFALAVFRAYMRTGRFRREAQQTTNIAHLSLGRLAEIEFPTPPLAEQKRIVAKVDQLMALCDDLEARQTKKREIGARLTRSALDALTTAEGIGEFDAAWKRVAVNFEVLIDRPRSVAALRMAVVDLASRGRLTSRAGRGNEVADLLEVRKRERRSLWELREHARLRRVGKETRDSKWKAAYEEPVFASDASLPPLPVGWAYVPIGLLGADPFCPVQTGPFGAQLHSSEFVPAGVPVVAVGNLTGTGFTEDGLYFITKTKADQLARYDVQGGDLLFARSGATLGKVCVAPPIVQNWRMTGHILRVRLDPRVIRADIAANWLWASTAVNEQITSTIRGGTRPGYNTTLLESIVLPVPPLEEQERIAAKVDILMGLCDDLEAKFQGAEHRAAKLVEAAVQELVA